MPNIKRKLYRRNLKNSVKIQVALSEEHKDRLKSYGEGNMSLGLQRLMEEKLYGHRVFCRKRYKRKDKSEPQNKIIIVKKTPNPQPINDQEIRRYY